MSFLQVLQVPLTDFEALLVSGDMLLPSVTTGFLALKQLKTLGMLPSA
jgi:hypothetical protein